MVRVSIETLGTVLTLVGLTSSSEPSSIAGGEARRLLEFLPFAGGLCTTLVIPNGYPCIEHTVQTDDGYILAVQNIPYGMNGSAGKTGKPVFLQHGVLGGGDHWILNSPKESLGFLLADGGFDVWIGNSRCTGWSYGHVTLSSTQKKYWHWTWDELAAYDLPAMLSLVYQQTRSKIFYIGHSQGTTLLMAGLTGTNKASQMTSQLFGAALLCPIAYISHIKSILDKTAASLYIDKIWNEFGDAEFNLYSDSGARLIDEVCSIQGIDCTHLFAGVTGNNCCLNSSRISFYTQFFPQPTSSMNMAHFAQMVRKPTFTKYDYGWTGNLLNYGQRTPPAYDVSTLPTSIPLLLLAGGADDLATPVDVQFLLEKMIRQNVTFVNVPRYGHADFVISTTSNVDVYQGILGYIQSLP